MAQAAGLSTCARPRPAFLMEYEVEASGVLCGSKLVTSMPVLQGLISPILSVPLLTALWGFQNLIKSFNSELLSSGSVMDIYWLLPLPHQDVCPDKVQVQWVPVVALVVYVWVSILSCYLLGNVCIRLRSNLWIVCYLCPVRIAGKVANFSKSCIRSSKVTGAWVCRYESTFQHLRGGCNWEVPLDLKCTGDKSTGTKGCSLKLMLSLIFVTADSTYRAVLRAL